MADQEDPDADGGLERLVASMVTSGLPENDPPVQNVAFPPPPENVAFPPPPESVIFPPPPENVTYNPPPENVIFPPPPDHFAYREPPPYGSLPARLWPISTDDEGPEDSFLSRVREVRQVRARRPSTLFSSICSEPEFKEWCRSVLERPPRPSSRRPRRRASPIKISRGNQTMTLAIPRFPVESRSFPVPWGKRLRTRTVATQTEEEEEYSLTGASAMGGSPVVPSWDPLPEEMFKIDDVSVRREERWSTEASLDTTPELEQVQPSGGNETMFSDISRRLASLMRDCIPEDTLDDSSPFSSQDDDDSDDESDDESDGEDEDDGATRNWEEEEEEVQVCFFYGNTRTVSTSTVHVGWRRGTPPPPSRVRCRMLSQGWSSNAAKTNVATQT